MTTTKIKTRVAYVLDDSGSMAGISRAAHQNFNARLADLTTMAADATQDIRASLYLFGNQIRREFHNVPAQHLGELKNYAPNQGATKLFEATIQALRDARELEKTDGTDCSFLIVVVTDGQNNVPFPMDVFKREVAAAQDTGRYTFAYLLPPGEKRGFCAQSGVPAGNVAEWEQTQVGVQRSAVVMSGGLRSYFDGRSKGVQGTKSFFPDLTGVRPADLQAVLTDVRTGCKIYTVPMDEDPKGVEIQPFVIGQQKFYVPGSCFYELTAARKAANKVQDYKGVIIRDRATGAMYTGDAARQILGLPDGQSVSLRPGDHGGYQVFIQSFSNNRKLLPGTGVVYYKDAV